MRYEEFADENEYVPPVKVNPRKTYSAMTRNQKKRARKSQRKARKS